MRFDLTDLALFLHVVQAGSITHGAARANLALAAASARIRNLEASLGAPLLERRRQGVIPTPAGLKLAAHARIMLAQADRLRDDLADFSGEFGGSVRLLSNTNALTAFLPEALGGFLAAHPRINVELQEMLSDEIVECIADGSADIGIVAGTVDTGALKTYAYRDVYKRQVIADARQLGRGLRVQAGLVVAHQPVTLPQAIDDLRHAAAQGHHARRRRRLRARHQHPSRRHRQPFLHCFILTRPTARGTDPTSIHANPAVPACPACARQRTAQSGHRWKNTAPATSPSHRWWAC